MRSLRLAGRPVTLLLAVHVALKLALLPRVLDAPLQGDEVAYSDSARALSNLVRDLVGLGPVDTSVAGDVVGHGWFMPGMSLVLTPVYLVDPDPSLVLVRCWLGLVSLALTVAVVVAVVRTFGTRYAAVLLVVPGLLPMWVLYSFTAWGDLDAGLVGVLLVCAVARAGQAVTAGRAPTLRQGGAVGLLAVVTLYLRSSALPLAVGMLALLALACLVALRGKERRTGVLSAVVAGGVFVALLLPWSLVASSVLGDRVVTTSTVPLSTAVAFGDTDQLCFGPCEGNNIWFAMAEYSREVGRAAGVSELTVQQQMSDYALADVTAHSYAGDVLGDLHRYTLEPSGFEPVFREVPGSPPDAVSRVVTWTTDLGFFAAGLVTVVGLVVVARRRVDVQVTGLLLKLGLLALLVQPFLHICTPRYWPIFAPVLGLTVAWCWDVAGSRRPAEPAGTEVAVRWLTVSQAVVAAGAVVLAATLVVLSR